MKIKKGNVLEIGPGGRPHTEANVLFDRFGPGADIEREGQTLTIDERPLIVGDSQTIPFQDNAFDKTLAYHVVEHFDNPNTSLGEINRVSRSGRIVCPSPLREAMEPRREYHRWIVWNQEDELVIVPRQLADSVLGLFSTKCYSYRQFIHWLWRAWRDEQETVYVWNDKLRWRVLENEEGKRLLEDRIAEQLDRLLARNYVSCLKQIAEVGISKIKEGLVSKYRPGEINTISSAELERISRCPECGATMQLSTDSLSCRDDGTTFTVVWKRT